MDLNNLHNDFENQDRLPELVGRKNPFTVPDNYFGTLESNILSQLKINVNSEGFTIPQRYFDQLADDTFARLTEAKLKDQTIDTGFTVPKNYFNELEGNILQHTSANKTPLIKRLKLQSWVSYAAAACVTIAISTGIYFNYQSSTQAQLSRITDQEIVNYLELHADAGDTPIIIENLDQQSIPASDKITDQELEQYLQETDLN